MYDPAGLELPPPERPGARTPPSYRETARDSGTLDAPEHERRMALAYYYGMCSYLDDLTAQLIDRLDRLGLADNTIVVYTSDHGDYAGEHEMFGKSTSLYDCLVRVPLILAGPDHLIPQGTRLGGFVESVDLFPTLLDLAGLQAPERVAVHGHSLRPIWQNPSGADRSGLDAAFAISGGWPLHRIGAANVPFGCPSSGRQHELMAMIRTGDWKYVHSAGRDVQELYNLAADPWELDNLWGAPEHGPLVTGLRERLLEWLLAHT
jgi:arylsulfatase A-like enzyme